VPHSGAPQPDADAGSLVEDLHRMNLVVGKMLVGHPVVQSPSTTPPPTRVGSISPAAGAVPPWGFPYGPTTAAQGYASSVNTSMDVYKELPGHHLRSVLNLVASTPASEYQDSAENSGLEHRAIASSRCDPRD
jgi:hypothetical protein